jgi:hypothetical protein
VYSDRYSIVSGRFFDHFAHVVINRFELEGVCSSKQVTGGGHQNSREIITSPSQPGEGGGGTLEYVGDFYQVLFFET